MEQRGPAAHNSFVNKRGRGEMTKSPITLQELRRRIYVKAKAEKSWRFFAPRFRLEAMDVRDCRTVRLPSSISRRFAERRPGSIGHITLRGKCAGARSAGKPHAACDVAGAGNGLTVRLVRHSHRKRGETDRPRLRSTAPALVLLPLLVSGWCEPRGGSLGDS